MSTRGVSSLTTDLSNPKLFTKKRKIESEEAELPARIQEYVPSQFSSPLSKEGREQRKHFKVKPTSAAKSLFIDQREYGITLYDLSRIYNLDFVHPPVHSKIHEFFALGEIMMLIECHFKDRLFLHDLKPLRERLRTIHLSSMSHEQMMSELGTFLYLLDRDGTPPSLEISSYTDFRAEEMRLEVERLLEVHHQVVDSSLEDKVPSGKTYYILRAFSRMALTSNQKLNKGALYAILRILENATSPVPGYLKPEHQAHILCVVRQIISNPAFGTLIESPFLVHPDLETLIRIDLKLPKEAKVESIDAMRDCLMALMFDVRQQDEPNCYVIGSLIYATENSAYKVLSQMVDWLKKGHFAFSNSVSIPIRPLVEKRLNYEKDLTHVVLPTDRAIELTTFQNITSALHLLPSPTTGRAPRSLKLTLCELLEENDAEEELLYAQRLYYTYKHNTLIHMMLAMIDFQYINSVSSSKSSTPFSEKKLAVLNVIFSNLPKFLSSEFVQRFKEAVSEKLWIENCTEPHIRLRSGKIQYGAAHHRKVIKQFNGDLDALCSVLSDSRRVFFLENGNYALIESISDLQQALVKIAEQINSNCDHRYIGTSPFAISVINSRKFKRAIANFCASQINKTGIKGADLLDADLLLLEDKGGDGTLVLGKVFNLHYKTVSYTANNAHQFLRNLYNKLHQIDSSILKSPVFLVQTQEHVFTLSPSHLSYSWSNATKFYDWVQDRIYSRAIAFRNYPISPAAIKRIIDRYYVDNEEQKIKALNHYLRYPITCGKFRQHFLNHIETPKSRALFLRIFDEETMKIVLNSELLGGVLHGLKVSCTEIKFRELQNIVSREISGPLPPFIVARRLRNIFIDNSLGIFPPHQIEQILCDLYRLPQSVDLGDYNWRDSNREDPAHSRLVMRYHVGNEKLSYFLRENETEEIEKDDEYSSFQITYPSIN